MGVDHSACHECLVNSLGCAKLYLLQEKNKLQLYWVEGHSDMLSSFLSHCYAKKRCNLHLGQSASNDIVAPKMAVT